MDFRDLTYILAVADNNSVTEAANKLYISQPSLSYIISKVEDELGVKLFYRKTNPITLTYAGQLYVQTAREIIQKMDNLKRELTEVGLGEKGQINLGIPTERAGYMIPKIIDAFSEQYPEVELKLTQSVSSKIFSDIDKGKVLIGILPGTESDFPANMQSEVIYRENIYLAAADGVITDSMIVGVHDDGIPEVDLKKMKHLPYVFLEKGRVIRKQVDQIFKTAGFVPKNVTEVSSNMTALMLSTNARLGVTIVPDRAIESLGGREKFNLYHYGPEQDSWEVHAIYKKETYLGKAERYLLDLMKVTF